MGPAVGGELDHQWNAAPEEAQRGPEAAALADGLVGLQRAGGHPGVEARLVADIGHEVEHLDPVALDDDLPADVGHGRPPPLAAPHAASGSCFGSSGVPGSVPPPSKRKGGYSSLRSAT